MAIETIDHVNIRSSCIAESMRFYGDLLGMSVTLLPGMESFERGAWICSADGRPAVHLNLAAAERDFLGEMRDYTGVTGSARVHHVAFECSAYDEMRARLADAGLALRFSDIPQISLRQIFVEDPNGVLIELNFR